MKTAKYILLSLLFFALTGLPGCTDLDVPPMNIVQDKDVFGSEGGIKSYLARIYGRMPLEDFRYSPNKGFNDFYGLVNPPAALTGEAIGRDQRSARTEEGYWTGGYEVIRDVNYFLETLPSYAANFTQEQLETWTGEAYFVRAVTYFALAKRYGGVPLVDKVLNYPTMSIQECDLPRASEEETYNKIASDFDMAISLLPDNNQIGRASKYAAYGMKSRAMLFAGSIAKYNTITKFDTAGKQLCGIPATKAAAYFELSYNAAKAVEGHAGLYKKAWKLDDKTAQYQNFIDLFFDDSSEEALFVRQYGYPESVHGYDVYNIPRQYMVGGYSSATNPTLDFVEMFDGLPKNADGSIKTLNDEGKYEMYENQMDFFANAEPRLRATVIFPGDQFKNETFEMWRGIYIGSSSGGIDPFIEPGTTAKYENTAVASLLSTSGTPNTQVVVTLNDGSNMNSAGRSGRFYGSAECSYSGFGIRKWMNPNMPAAEVKENRSDQPWIELRYAEVLLNRAEAAYELFLLGKGEALQTDAFLCINQIRERAGADLLADNTALNDINIIRTERRKELSFENKTWYDLQRWRVLHIEQNNTNYRVLMPFYVKDVDKWIFDARYNEENNYYTWNSTWYYKKIPADQIEKSQNLIQNPGY